MIPEIVRGVLEAGGIAYALIGGLALAARGHPRSTFDIDFLTTDRRALDEAIWKPVRDERARVDIRRGDPDDPLAGVVHLALSDGTDIDVVVGKFAWQSEIVARAEKLDLGGETVPVPRTADLILLKLFAGGFQDASDVHALLQTAPPEELMREVESRLTVLPDDARALWQRIVA
jgi:hypothetical protein